MLGLTIKTDFNPFLIFADWRLQKQKKMLTKDDELVTGKFLRGRRNYIPTYLNL